MPASSSPTASAASSGARRASSASLPRECVAYRSREVVTRSGAGDGGGRAPALRAVGDASWHTGDASWSRGSGRHAAGDEPPPYGGRRWEVASGRRIVVTRSDAGEDAGRARPTGRAAG